jgi:hypothetical protein
MVVVVRRISAASGRLTVTMTNKPYGSRRLLPRRYDGAVVSLTSSGLVTGGLVSVCLHKRTSRSPICEFGSSCFSLRPRRSCILDGTVRSHMFLASAHILMRNCIATSVTYVLVPNGLFHSFVLPQSDFCDTVANGFDVGERAIGAVRVAICAGHTVLWTFAPGSHIRDVRRESHANLHGVGISWIFGDFPPVQLRHVTPLPRARPWREGDVLHRKVNKAEGLDERVEGVVAEGNGGHIDHCDP